MFKLISFVALLCLIASVSCQGYSWQVQKSNWVQIGISISFQNDTNGWVGGGTSSTTPLLLETNDAAVNFTNQPLEGSNNAAFLSIAVSDDNKSGVAGGLGIFTLPCGAYLDNGEWHVADLPKSFVCTAQDASIAKDGSLILVGDMATLKESASGVAISSDNGKTWKTSNWNQTTGARYASFISKDFGFVAGGQWPTDESDGDIRDVSFITRHLRIQPEGGVEFQKMKKYTKADLDEYVGVIASTQDGGQTWNMLWNVTEYAVYFNQIACTDAQTCWVTAEGTDEATMAPIGLVFATTDGWKSHSVQLKGDGLSLTSISMTNSTFGWAAGATINANNQASGVFYQTTDGKTWNEVGGQLRNFFAIDVDAAAGNFAYAAGITPLGRSSLARYAPTMDHTL